MDSPSKALSKPSRTLDRDRDERPRPRREGNREKYKDKKTERKTVISGKSSTSRPSPSDGVLGLGRKAEYCRRMHHYSYSVALHCNTSTVFLDVSGTFPFQSPLRRFRLAPALQDFVRHRLIKAVTRRT